MSKTVTVASKFTQDEIDKIDYFVSQNNTTRSALFHDLVMKGVNGIEDADSIIPEPSNIREVMFYFLEDFAYFWKNKEYKGIINGEDASVYFGGEWIHYKLADLPVEVVY